MPTPPRVNRDGELSENAEDVFNADRASSVEMLTLDNWSVKRDMCYMAIKKSWHLKREEKIL